MALRAAVANGNWSLASTWNNGVLPAPGDVVASNGFTVTIDQNINIDTLTNAAVSPVSAVPIMTGYTTPSGIVTFSSEFPGYSAFRVFDGSTSNGWITANTVLTGWVAYEFTTAKIITSYVLAGGATGGNSFPRNWTFEGWDGSNWIVLHTVTGNTNTSTYTGNFTNTTAYIKYRINITLNNGNTSYTGINEMYLYDLNSVLTTTTAGGGFVLNSGVTVTCTGSTSISCASNTCISYSATGVSTINCSGNILLPTANNIRTIVITNGTLNVSAVNIQGVSGGSNRYGVDVSGASTTFNYTGTVFTGGSDYGGIIASSGCTVSIVGNLTANGGSNHPAVNFSGSVLNVTGTIIGGPGGGTGSPGISISAGTLNVTGNVEGSQSMANNGINATGVCTINVSGRISGKLGNGISSSAAIYLNHIGVLESSSNTTSSAIGLFSTSSSAIHLLSGPFISHSTGILPIYVTRMHYRRTLGSYYEFRDSSTNGALPPATNAPTTRLNSPEVGSDLPVVTDVRFGTTYGYGSLIGTVRMPTANQVTYGVAVDNTFGAAVLTAASVWDYLVDNITTANSIGSRLKNVSTPQTVGSQLASLL